MDVVTTTPSDILSTSAKCGGTIGEDLGEYWPIVDRLLQNKFQLFHRSRQKITSSIYRTILLKPLQMFTDSKQDDKTFILGGFRYEPMRDMYEIELYEYDNTTVINLL